MNVIIQKGRRLKNVK